MADDKKHVYDESKVKTLSSLEHIRLRTGMYLGALAIAAFLFPRRVGTNVAGVA
jgi:DNA gyrase/topoisomerase IV subunit B